MIKFSIFICLLFSQSVFAYTKNEFCAQRQSSTTLRELHRDFSNLLPLKNSGGMLGLKTGVCWWHSRLQRRFSYLARFRPELPKPSIKEVKKIIQKIKKKDSIVEIPGFKNLDEFGLAYKTQIQKSLNNWMLGDSVIRQTWTKGIKAKKFKTHQDYLNYLEALYKEFKSNNGILFQILNFKGISAHAWLITDITKDDHGEYHFEIIDSNKPQSPIKFTPDLMRMNPDSSKPAEYTLYNGEYQTDPYKHPLFKYSNFNSLSFFQAEEAGLKAALKKYCK